jgi:Fe-S-cluster-containing dehydrogenase component
LLDARSVEAPHHREAFALGGDPECVKLCPSGAISYQEVNTSSLAKRKAFAAKFKDVFEEVG